MSKYNLYVNDILRAINWIERDVGKIGFGEFKNKRVLIDAVAMRLQIIGESIKKLPKEKKQSSEINWKYFEEIRNFISHAYFLVDAEILWDIIKNEIPKLKRFVKNEKVD